MTTVSDFRPSGDGARIALIAAAVAAAGMLLFPLATLGRGGTDADAVLLHLGGRILNLSSYHDAPLPPTAIVLGLGWATLGLLVATVVGALRRATWTWMTALLAFVLAGAAVLRLDATLGEQVTRVMADSALRPGAKRQLRNFYAGGGMNLGLFLPLLGGLIAAGAGLSGRPWWHERFGRLRGLLVPVSAITLAIAVGAVVVLAVQPAVNLSGRALDLPGGWLAKSDVVYFVYSSLFAPVTALNPLLDSLKLATPLIFTGLSVAFAFRTGLFNIGAPGQLTMGAVGAMLAGVYGPSALGWALLPFSVVAAGAAGALWGAIPGVLKARFGSSEVINTIMLNYIASAVFITLIGTEEINGLGLAFAIVLVCIAAPIIYKLLLTGIRAPVWVKALVLLFISFFLLRILLGASYFSASSTPNPFKAEGFEARSELLQEGARLPTMLQLLNVGQGGQTALSVGLLVALVAFVAVRALARTRRTLYALLAALVLGALTWRIGIPVNVAGSQLNASFLIALACVAFFGTLMWRTSTGYALRAVGLSPKAAEYGGISVARGTVLAMTIAGMFAGLAGLHYVNGGALDEYRLKGNMPVNVGFDGIAVALMGQNTPVGVVVSSLLFGTIDTGGLEVSRQLSNVNRDIVTVLKALIVLFIAAGGFLSRRITDPPPPQLLAAGPSGPPPGAGLTPEQAARERTTPAPNVAQTSEDLTRGGNR